MKYLLILAVLLLPGCGDVTSSQYVYPEFAQKAEDSCAPNDGIERLVITSSRRPGHINAGAKGFVICKNTARFDFSVLVVRNTE